MEMHDWTQTRLWADLQSANDAETQAVVSLLSASMPDIQAVLAAGGTAVSDFTLHDSGHAFRVAQRMIDVIPSESISALSCYERALLLLSAYLHDIGMTPLKSRLSSLHKYLLMGHTEELSQEEVTDLQHWLDDYRGGIVPPIATEPLSVATLETAEEIITYYARHKHNDWSEDWIRQYFYGRKMGTYVGWLEDLILLCRSHHYGYEQLRDDRFRPRLAGTNGAVVNLRYLASVLRIADVLEFDPERTPSVVFKHRDVNARSAIFWHKDHEISLRIDNGRVLISARPTSARLHKAIEDTVSQINDELILCKRLAEEFPFHICPFLSAPTGHLWNLASTSHANIEPLRQAYEYIDGAFRPNTSRILNLLSGVELYGTPFAAVRELLQNSMDAIREQMAYVRLRRANPADPTHDTELTKSHLISLQFEKDEEGYWLICADSGVGMNKRIIRDYLLISGQSQRHDVLELERRCRQFGFSLGRTGQFGIGVLSYFMIARKIDISTRRSQESESSEGHGWHFSTDGIGSFGELKIDRRIETGTTVRLLLRPSVITSSPEEWISKLLNYLAKTVRRLPCRLDITGNSVGVAPRSLSPGWTDSLERLNQRICASLDRRHIQITGSQIPTEMLPARVRAKHEQLLNEWEVIKSEIRDRLKCEVFEGELADGLGVFRARVPYFDLDGSTSLRFLRAKSDSDTIHLEKIRQGYSVVIEGDLSTSWKGISSNIEPLFMKVSTAGNAVRSYRRPQITNNMFMEIDFIDGGGISVDRSNLNLPETAKNTLEQALNDCRARLRSFVLSTQTSRYHLLNCRTSNTAITMSNSNWIRRTKDTTSWNEIQFPTIDANVYTYSDVPRTRILLGMKEVHVTSCVGNTDDNSPYDGITWHGEDVAPNRVLFAPSHRFRLAPLWLRFEPASLGLATSRFPPMWKDLIGAFFRHYAGLHKSQTIWNEKNKIARNVTMEALTWCKNTFNELADPLKEADDILKSKANASAWIAHAATSNYWQIWNGLMERDPSFLSQVFAAALGISRSRVKFQRVLFWSDDTTDSRLRVLTPSGWHSYSGTKEILEFLPPPDNSWTLVQDREHAEAALLQPESVRRGLAKRTNTRGNRR